MKFFLALVFALAFSCAILYIAWKVSCYVVDKFIEIVKVKEAARTTYKKDMEDAFKQNRELNNKSKAPQAPPKNKEPKRTMDSFF